MTATPEQLREIASRLMAYVTDPSRLETKEPLDFARWMSTDWRLGVRREIAFSAMTAVVEREPYLIHAVALALELEALRVEQEARRESGVSCRCCAYEPGGAYCAACCDEETANLVRRHWDGG